MLHSFVKSTLEPVTSVFSAKTIFPPLNTIDLRPAIVSSPEPQHPNATKLPPVVFIHLQNALCATLLLSHSYKISGGVLSPPRTKFPYSHRSILGFASPTRSNWSRAPTLR